MSTSSSPSAAPPVLGSSSRRRETSASVTTDSAISGWLAIAAATSPVRPSATRSHHSSGCVGEAGEHEGGQHGRRVQQEAVAVGRRRGADVRHHRGHLEVGREPQDVERDHVTDLQRRLGREVGGDRHGQRGGQARTATEGDDLGLPGLPREAPPAAGPGDHVTVDGHRGGHVAAAVGRDPTGDAGVGLDRPDGDQPAPRLQPTGDVEPGRPAPSPCDQRHDVAVGIGDEEPDLLEPERLGRDLQPDLLRPTGEGYAELGVLPGPDQEALPLGGGERPGRQGVDVPGLGDRHHQDAGRQVLDERLVTVDRIDGGHPGQRVEERALLVGPGDAGRRPGAGPGRRSRPRTRPGPRGRRRC